MSYSILSCVSLRFVALSFNIMHIGVVGLSARIRVSVRNRIHSRLPLLLSTSGHHFGFSGPAPIRSSSSSLLPLFFLSLLLFLCHLLLTPSPLLSLLSSLFSLLFFSLSLARSLAPPLHQHISTRLSAPVFHSLLFFLSSYPPPLVRIPCRECTWTWNLGSRVIRGGVLNGFFLFYLVVFAVFAAVFLAGAFFAGVFFAAFSSAFSVVFASAFTVVLVVAFRVVFFLGSSALFALRV